MVIIIEILALFLINTVLNRLVDAQDKPHIIFILADDLGWNDVGFHGSNQIPTPNIDALAYSGIILNNYYVTPICTPSRSALMTGKYPIHTGMQHNVLFGAEPRGLPLTEKLLPQYLRELGYVNRIVGKWHLGSYKKEFTPTNRGFDSHFGFWTGHQDYYDHTAVENPGWGLDFRDNLKIAYDYHGQYSTDLFTKQAINLINTHNKSAPLFLYLAHTAVHSGNPYEPLRAPDETIKQFQYIENYERRKFAGMNSHLDKSVGEVVLALALNGMLMNSIIIFSTDNGGPAAGFNLNAASNYPLRGVKNTLWEGGLRGAAFIWSPLLKQSGRVSEQFMHISDWLPTIFSAVGGNESALPEGIDGKNLWPALSENTPSPRTELLHNIDDIFGNAALTIGPWKLLKGATYNGSWDSWYGPSGRNYTYNFDLITNSLSGKALQKLKIPLDPKKMAQLRQKAEIVCIKDDNKKMNDDDANQCIPLESPCLFNILEDPCEQNNLAKEYPTILANLQMRLMTYNATALPPGNLPLDSRGNPKYWNNVWTNFGDFLN